MSKEKAYERRVFKESHALLYNGVAFMTEREKVIDVLCQLLEQDITVSEAADNIEAIYYQP